MIYVVNKKNHNGDGVYIGRPSPLGNPFSSKSYGLGEKVDTLDDALAMYENWLKESIQNKNRAVLNELLNIHHLHRIGDVHLICWCAPKRCHGHIIRKIILNAESLFT